MDVNGGWGGVVLTTAPGQLWKLELIEQVLKSERVSSREKVLEHLPQCNWPGAQLSYTGSCKVPPTSLLTHLSAYAGSCISVYTGSRMYIPRHISVTGTWSYTYGCVCICVHWMLHVYIYTDVYTHTCHAHVQLSISMYVFLT